MSGPPAARAPDVDPFGVGWRERALRRLAGATAAVAVVGLALAWWAPEGALLAVAVVYLGAVPLSALLEARRPAPSDVPVARYAGAGALLAVAASALLGGPLSTFAWVAALITVPIGFAGGALVPVVGIRTPRRAVPWVAGTGGVVALALAGALWLDSRPPAPYGTWVIITEPAPAVIADVGDVDGLADRLAAGFDQVSRGGGDPTTHDAWIAVGPPVAERLPGTWLAAHDIAPVTLPDGRPARLVTVDLGGERRCVAALRELTAVLDGTCDAWLVAEQL